MERLYLGQPQWKVGARRAAFYLRPQRLLFTSHLQEHCLAEGVVLEDKTHLNEVKPKKKPS